MSTFILLATVYLDSGTPSYAVQPVLSPAGYGHARVLQWGSINRSIPVPAGLPQVGDANIRLADTDFFFRNLFAAGTQTPINRSVVIRMIQEGTSFASAPIVYTGVITKFSFGDGYLELALHDVTLAWLDEEWPGTLESGVYMPTIFGRNIQNSPTEQHGLIPLPHIGFDLAIGDRYGLAIHTVNDVIAIHRHNTDGTWEVVDGSEYSITEDDVVIGGITYNGTYIDFTAQQDEGVEIRADVEGWDTRPAWGSLGSASGLLRNPIDFFINIMEAVQTKIGQTFTFDYTAIEAIRLLFAYMMPFDAGTNVIANPGGETGSVGSQATSWSNASGAGMLIATDEVHSGAQSMKIISSSQDSINRQFVDIVKGHVYEVSGWIKVAAHTAQPGRYAFFDINPSAAVTIISKTNINGDPVSTHPDVGIQLDGSAHGWTYVACRFRANSTDDDITFACHIGNGGSATATAWFDDVSFAEVNTRAYFCDGAILSPITLRSLLSQFLTSANLDLFQKVDGKISLSFMHTADSGRPVFTETLQILQGSYQQNSPDGYANRIKCKMAYNYAIGEWSIEQIHDNTADQDLLGVGSPVVPKIKAVDLEAWFVRDRYTMADVAAHRAGFLTMSSYDQQFELPLELGAARELCEQVGITIRSGLASSGFTNQEVRIDAITLNLDSFTATVYARIYREQERNNPSALTYELDASITMTAGMDAAVHEEV